MRKLVLYALFIVFGYASTVLALPVNNVEVGDGLAFFKIKNDQVLVTAFGDGWADQYGFEDVNWGTFTKTGFDDYSITSLSGMDLDDFIPHFIPLKIVFAGAFGTIEAIDATYSINVYGDLKRGFSYATVFAIDDEHGSAAAPVPEPTTLLLFGFGAAGISLVGRRRKKE